MRENAHEATYIQRTFEEFQELHSKLRLLFPSSLLPSFPSRFVIGRPRGEAGAERRREELNGYIWHLIHAAPEVAEVGGVPSGLWGVEEAAEGWGARWQPGSALGSAEGAGRGGGTEPAAWRRPGRERGPEEEGCLSLGGSVPTPCSCLTPAPRGFRGRTLIEPEQGPGRPGAGSGNPAPGAPWWGGGA